MTNSIILFKSKLGGNKVYPNYEFKMINDSIYKNKAWITFESPEGKIKTIEVVKIDVNWLVNIDSKKYFFFVCNFIRIYML